MIKKIATEGVVACVKAIGSGLGSKVVRGKENTTPEVKVRTSKGIVEIITNKYDWDVIEKNISKTTHIIKRVVPSVAKGFVEIMIIPVGVASLAFPFVGAGATITIFSLTKGVVICHAVSNTAGEMELIMDEEVTI